MSPDLRAQFESAKTEARALFDGLPESSGRQRPADGGWSMAECLDHLNVVGRLYVTAIGGAIEDGRRRGLAGDGFRPLGLFERLIVRSMDAPPLFRTRSPMSFRPAADILSIAHSLPAFVALQDELIALLDRAAGLDFTRIKVTSPASRYVRLSVAAAFAVTAAHQRRHLWQARQARDARGSA